ncbi:MAG: alanine racemase domain-containing protein [Elusimicrobia bacterium]|nr:MAG: alanine racemase domain-containing protein [Elusimicrobiota bacterium]KAF0153447.1 MAG: alanine racemase domain-containing protein [Elusimicrobiota bacterium]
MPTAELTRKTALMANIKEISSRIGAGCLRGGRDAGAVKLLIVTKYAQDDDVRTLAEAGALAAAGESRVQDARARWTGDGPLAGLRGQVELHFIGHLQTNKAKTAAEIFDWVDSVDSLKVASELSRHAAAFGKKLPVLIQLRLNDSPTQSGVTQDEAPALLAAVRGLPGVEPRGYMGIAPEGASPAELKDVFRKAKAVYDRDFQGTGNYLSLGMSDDFEAAVEAGSNLPRLGGLVFGQ